MKNNEILCAAFGDCMMLIVWMGHVVFGPIWPGTKASMMEDSFRTDLQCLADCMEQKAIFHCSDRWDRMIFKTVTLSAKISITLAFYRKLR